MTEKEIVAQLERQLNVPPGLFYKLKDEDDWSFIIKVHALLETALNHLVTNSLNRPELMPVIERINLDGQAGKLAFATQLGLLGPEHLAFLRLLSSFRNKVAHKIQYVAFSFQDHVHDLDEKQFREFAIKALLLPAKSNIAADMFRQIRNHLELDPRSILWAGALDVLMLIYSLNAKAERDRLRMELHETFYNAHYPGLISLGGLNQIRLADLLRLSDGATLTGGLQSPPPAAAVDAPDLR